MRKDLSKRLSALTHEQRKLLASRMQQQGLGEIREDSISRRPGDGPERLSFAQERLWFLDQFAPGNAAYHVVPAIHLRGNLRVDALEQSLREIVRRHESLRTSFPAIDERPMQAIAKDVVLPFAVHDLSTIADSDVRLAEAKRIARDEACQPFDLATGPLIRVALIKLATDEHVLIIAMHHIVSDGWTRRVFMRELVELYTAFYHGRPSPLAEPPIQYVDYALWQRRLLEGGPLERHLAYWKQKLGGALPVLELPGDRPRPAVKMARGERQAIVLPESLTDALRVVSRRNRTTVFMTAMAGFKALLHRYTGLTDICVGTPTVGRDRVEVEGLVGFFVNTLVMRTDLSGDPTFEELLVRVRETALGAYEAGDAPFERVVEAVQPQRTLAHTPLFQVAFDLQNPPPPPLEAPDLAIGAWTPAGGRGDLDVFLSILDTGTSKFDLLVSMMDTPTGLMGLAEYSTDLFDRATITRFLEHYGNLLEAAAAREGARLSELPLVGPAEARLVVHDWNETVATYAGEPCLHQLIEARAKRCPDAMAVQFGDATLTYAELNARANQLARRLRTHGAGPEVLVGVCLERSLELVVSLLAVLKAGAAYVPIDPGYPADRIAYMLDDARVALLVTDAALAGHLNTGDAKVVRIDREWATIATESADDFVSGVTSDGLAYVIYTSGSTGRPKGAMNTHRGIRNRLLWMQGEYRLDGNDKVLQKTPFSFDVSVWEFFWPLVAGATLVVAKPDGHKDPAYLVDVIAREGVTTLHFVPSMLAVFIEAETLPRCTALKRVICSGEALGLELQAKFFERTPGVELHNLYGPTEAAIDVSYHACERSSERGFVPIGKPIANTRLYVFDRTGRPTPIGVPGELHIGGVNLGRGYWQRPELTAERWVPSPFPHEAGERLYRTGDVVRWRVDGSIEFIGRMDHQVKVRGFRIELGEIEATLATHPGVRECVVDTREVTPGDVRIVAYLVTDGDPGPTDEALKSHLKAALPEYMLPSAFVTLAAIPVTPNGKVDRKALPAPEARPGSGAGTGTRRPLEAAVARIWTQVLGVDDIGLADNFFDLGGHSLLATQVVSRVRKELQVNLPVREIFQAPTIEGLAARIAEIREPVEEVVARIWSEVLGVERVGLEDSFFDLGGHSLLATQVVSRLRKELGVELSVRALFETPNLEQLARRVEAARRVEVGIDELAILPAERDDRIPLSFSQQRLWFLEQMGDESPAFNIPAGLRLKGSLDYEALRRALEAIVHRHESLRTSFADELGKPYQVIAPPTRLELPVIDISATPAAELEDEVERQSWQEALTSFNVCRDPVCRDPVGRDPVGRDPVGRDPVGRDPVGRNPVARDPVCRDPALLRVRLVHIRADDHLLLITVHHIVFDGWSMLVFYDELSALYRAFCHGKRSPLASPTLQYADFAYWQRRYLQGDVLDRQVAYWKRQLGDLPAHLEIPTDRPRPRVPSLKGRSEVFTWPKRLADGLRALSQRESVSLFMTLHAAVATLLYRYSGQADVAVGSFIANRNRVEVEKLVGFFVNTLVIRTKLDGDPTFRELLVRVGDSALDAFANQDLPFERLLEILNPVRDPSRTPFFEHVLVLQNHNDPKPQVDLEGLTFEFPERHGNTAHFDWVLNMTEVADGLHGDLRYATDLFAPATMQRLIGHLRTLLEAAVADPDQRISALPLLSVAEHDQIVTTWNGRELSGDLQLPACAHELFEAAAARTPDATAVVFDDARLTYRELDELANRLANHLRDCGVGAEARVGICVERSIEMVVAVIAVLKAGGAYVPLDPTYPAERLAFMLADAGCPVLLTQVRLVGDLPAAARKVLLDGDPDWLTASATKPDVAVSPAQLAYTIYTSGSTGRPKGVMVTHANLVASFRFWAEDYDLRSLRSHLQMASFSFDVFSGDLVRALLSGGKLVVCPHEILLEGKAIHALMQREAVDCAEFVPAVMRNLVAYLEASGSSVRFMKVLCVGSDVWNLAEHARLKNLCGPETRLINSFGVTEATIDSTFQERLPDNLPAGGTVPIGRPFAGCKIYILDPHLRPTPVGVAGQLHIGGPGVARGYLGRPDLTAEKFIPDPFAASNAGSRLYATGDLARFRADGDTDFLGRVDSQVKIRGFRVELGEVEAALAKHPSVTQAVCVARDEAGGSKRLVGYVTVSAEPSVAVLRGFLKERLPDYMVPTAFVVLREFPLSPNGKVDRRALPAPEVARADVDPYLAPRTALEEVVAGIWADVLAVDQVGIEDNFFELGGHSLLATQLVARVRDALGVGLPLRALFTEPTVAGLALAILQGETDTDRVERTARVLIDTAGLSDEEVRALIGGDAGDA